MTESAKSLVERVFAEVWSTGNLEAVDDFYAEDFVGHYPFGSSYRGRDGVRSALSRSHEAFPDYRETVEDLFGEGDRVAVRFTVTGTHEGDYLGIAPTGRTVTMTEMAIFRVLKGKIVEQWSSPDLLGLLTQLDAVDMKEDE